MNTEIIGKAKAAIEIGQDKEAIEMLLPLAEAGDAQAQYLLGNMFWSSSSEISWDWTLDWLKKAAAQNYPDAYYRLSALDPSGVYNPLPVHPDCFRLLQKAAELGSAPAQSTLAYMHYNGESKLNLDISFAHARIWYQKAAENGDPIAQFAVGRMLLAGEGGVADQKQGIHWLESCAKNTEDYWSASDAVRLLQQIYKEGLFGIAADEAKVKYWRQVEESVPAINE
jgi:TPR repeat protein